MNKPVTLSGMRPTGPLHLGHLHGVLENWLQLQQKYQCFFFAADWHALTTHYEQPENIGQQTLDMVIDWLATGIDPKKTTIFVQSSIPAHAELHVLLSMITPLGWLERMPSYKEQKQKLHYKDLGTYGFLGYPLLQAADVLLYQAKYVPVGEDQQAHIELTREIARRFNFLYQQDLFQEPQALLTSHARFPGIDGQKMSKSYGNTISLREAPDSVQKKIKSMPTDPARVRRTDPGNPELCPVWALHRVYSEQKTRDWVTQGCTTAGIGCIQCKQPVIDQIIMRQQPIIAKVKELSADKAQVHKIIASGNAEASAIAEQTLTQAKAVFSLFANTSR